MPIRHRPSAAPKVARKPMRISEAALSIGKKREVKLDPFRGIHGSLHPPGVGPTPDQLREMALDQGSIISSATPPPLQGWAGYNPLGITGWAYNNLTSRIHGSLKSGSTQWSR